MIVTCPSCNTQYRLDSTRLKDGRGRLRCARCKTVFPVESESAPARAPARAESSPGSRLDVAVVAAEAGPVRQRLATALQALGLRVVVADDGPNALEMARRSRPRLVAATHWLPGLTGAEVIEAVREDPALAATRTLIVGGPVLSLRWPVPEAAVHGADAGVSEEARESDIEPLLRALLGMAGGVMPPPPEPELRAHARVTIADLHLYHAAEIEEGRRAGRLHVRVADYLGAARTSCFERFPALRFAPAALEAWDDEVRKSLRRA